MACGVPCVTSNTGGLPELVKNGVSGFTADVGDIDKMAKLVKKIIGDEKMLRKLSDSSRQYAIRNFHVKKIIPQYIELYQKVLNEK
jgi:glycosyltransferase involved in cell wall biosynthesis